MLKDDFYIIQERIQTEKGWEYRILLNALHPIYQAHFPKNPVTPGVCLVQLVKEVVADHYSASFFIRTIKNVKFLTVLNPVENDEITIRFTCRIDENGMYIVSAVICKDELVFSKLNLYLTEVSENE